MVNTLARNWWALVLRGVAAIIFGIVAFLLPGATVTALVLLFGAYALLDGIFTLVAGIRQATGHKVAAQAGQRWWLLVIEGLAGIAAGILTFIWPGMTALVLLYVIAIWAIITGLFEVLAAIRLRREIEGEGWLALAGLASMVFGIILLARPAAGALAVVWVIGAYGIVFGIAMLVLGFRLRHWMQQKDAAYSGV